jgi:hypothetical protein
VEVFGMVCIWIFRVFVGLYVFALAIWLIGTFGWFGADRDPLSGVFLGILGFPWTKLVDLFPERSWPVVAALTPAVNAGLVYAVCRWIR